ncbi:hypothetical protein EJ06DRAFT_525384 [Trichodelitschia bisporula]|uniref:Apple domain-containing protein n=1 Tax=Trichodelitschia bisporula TaxID=703511 RepID=A0A6G1HHX3_9PEZI|nr:hypothetical protein EJ06DRAFT_525384 [Trichodelitschia bisporula]
MKTSILCAALASSLASAATMASADSSVDADSFAQSGYETMIRHAATTVQVDETVTVQNSMNAGTAAPAPAAKHKVRRAEHATMAASGSTSVSETISLTCPGDDRKQYSLKDGSQWIIRCGVTHEGNPFGSVAKGSLNECVRECNKLGLQVCDHVAWKDGQCYLASNFAFYDGYTVEDAITAYLTRQLDEMQSAETLSGPSIIPMCEGCKWSMGKEMRAYAGSWAGEVAP